MAASTARATASAVSRTCRSYGSPSRRIRSGRLWAVKIVWTPARSPSGNRPSAATTVAATAATKPG